MADADRTDLRDGDTTDALGTDRTSDVPEPDRMTSDADRTMADRTTDASTTDARDDEMSTAGSREQGVEWSAAEPLVAEDAAVDFKTRWEVIQQGFVDDPRNSVSEADKLVDDLLKRLSMSFEEQHQGLEKQWSDGEPSTEDLRAALQKYRAFFQRLLAM
jgi:hypothetical protein